MSNILIKSPSFEMVKCDSCVNPVPLALAYHVEDGRDRHLLACSMRCAGDIAGKLHEQLVKALDQDDDTDEKEATR